MVWIRPLLLSGCLLLAGGMLAQTSSPESGAAATVLERENLVEAQPRGRKWEPAQAGLDLAAGDLLRTGEYSRAALRFSDLSILRVDELTTLKISPPVSRGAGQTIDVSRGGVYLHHRGRPGDVDFRTPAANGAIRGTEFALRVAGDGRTTVAMLEGEMELRNAQGRVTLHTGEMGEVEVGRAPRKTAMIEAANVIQWCLYYPGVIDPAEFGGLTGKSVAAYRTGDLPGALRAQRESGGSAAGTPLFRAAVVLSSGQVDAARSLLRRVPASHPGRLALEQTMAAVQGRPWQSDREPETASEWLAESFYRQSRDQLAGALLAARRATEVASGFGFAWVRLAELEFSFGRISAAEKALARGLALSPRNAQAHALQGFLLAAKNRTKDAERAFAEAIELDGALGNAWLGRGLVAIRQGRDRDGRLDLQTAAALEPNRSLLRSYLAKGYGDASLDAKADAEIERARTLDPEDPTPWLYSALQRQQENRLNEAITDLETSIERNENRGLYRSQFLLDQDRAVRQANLALIYRRNGMLEESVREAVRGVASDYTSASSHLFLANAYNDLRDPERVRLRFEAGWLSELLLSQLLAPVGGGSLSQFVSQHEYSKLFESDGVGFSSLADYFSDGRIRGTASVFGTSGNLGFALDGEYYYQDGIRPNNELSRYGLLGTFKLQLGLQDTLFLRVRVGDQRTGDVFQRYDPADASTVATEVEVDGVTRVVRVPNTAGLTFSTHEEQDPGQALLGWHREWAPGHHTLLLAGRLANEYTVTMQGAGIPLLYANATPLFPFELPFEVGYSIPRDAAWFRRIAPALGEGLPERLATAEFDFELESDLVAHSVEWQQIATVGPMTFIGGVRYQWGDFDTRARLTHPDDRLLEDRQLFPEPPADQEQSVDYQRLSIYLYDLWHVTPWLSVTAGLTYDRLEYPENFLNPPVNEEQDSAEKLLPKAGFILQPWRGATVRAAYSEALGGASFDEGIRLEPSQVAGFLQVHRNLLSESLVGSLTGSEFRFMNVSLEQKLPTRTYLGVEYQNLQQDTDRSLGAFEGITAYSVIMGFLPTSLEERLRYREQGIIATARQLVGDHWVFGVRYRYTQSELEQSLDGIGDALRLSQDPVNAPTLARRSRRRAEGHLHELNLHAIYNHPSGFFARAEANWIHQHNDDQITNVELIGPEFGPYSARVSVVDQGQPSEDFWHLNLFAGYRFHRSQCEVSVGVLNLTDEDYRLNPLNPYEEFVRERTFMVRCRLNF